MKVEKAPGQKKSRRSCRGCCGATALILLAPPALMGLFTMLCLGMLVVSLIIMAFVIYFPFPTGMPAVEEVTEVSDVDGMVMVYVPEGDFAMGSTDEDIDRVLASCIDCDREWYDHEQPQHTVRLDAFWIDKTEVTNAMYEKCVEAGVCEEPGCAYFGSPEYADHPVICVDWYRAQTYCEWAGRRLPMEAEWEKAASGTDGRVYPWGGRINCSKSNFDIYGLGLNLCNPGGATAPAGSYQRGISPYGALNMAGNASEWVADQYDSSYYSNSPEENPQGPASGEDARILRGGSWEDDEWNVRTTTRYRSYPVFSSYGFGFRCALSEEE